MGEKVESGESGNSFENAASSVSAAERKAETPPADVKKPEAEKFIIDEEWAVATVQLVFVPLKKYDHPAWEVSDDEARMVSPKMQVFLQNVFDRYVPDFLNRFASKNKQLSELGAALLMLYFIKRSQVKKFKLVDAMIEAAKKEESRPSTGDPLLVPEPPGVEA